LIIGGVVGTVARYLTVAVAYQKIHAGFPFGTLIVNTLGCLLIGFFDVIAQKKIGLAPHIRVMLMAGFCGAFTTFSSLILDAYNLSKEAEIFRACLYVVGTVLLGFLAFRLGIWLGEMV
jgi:fluoride exporter